MLEIINASIAVTAPAHNPSILHPSFLTAQRIVPDDWEVAEGPICTPALAIVKFSRGVVITVDQKKLQAVDNAAGSISSSSELPGIIERYTRTLPHVRYSGVGINFSGFVETTEADAILFRFLNTAILSGRQATPTSVGIRLLYPHHDVQFRLAIDSGTITSPTNETRTGIVLAANYHTDIGEIEQLDHLARSVREFGNYLSDFQQAVESLLPQGTLHVSH